MMKRQYSVSSEDALRKLSDCEQRLKDFEDRFSQYVFAATTDQNKDTLVAMKNDLAVMVSFSFALSTSIAFFLGVIYELQTNFISKLIYSARSKKFCMHCMALFKICCRQI